MATTLEQIGVTVWGDRVPVDPKVMAKLQSVEDCWSDSDEESLDDISDEDDYESSEEECLEVQDKTLLSKKVILSNNDKDSCDKNVTLDSLNSTENDESFVNHVIYSPRVQFDGAQKNSGDNSQFLCENGAQYKTFHDRKIMKNATSQFDNEGFNNHNLSNERETQNDCFLRQYGANDTQDKHNTQYAYKQSSLSISDTTNNLPSELPYCEAKQTSLSNRHFISQESQAIFSTTSIPHSMQIFDTRDHHGLEECGPERDDETQLISSKICGSNLEALDRTRKRSQERNEKIQLEQHSLTRSCNTVDKCSVYSSSSTREPDNQCLLEHNSKQSQGQEINDRDYPNDAENLIKFDSQSVTCPTEITPQETAAMHCKIPTANNQQISIEGIDAIKHKTLLELETSSQQNSDRNVASEHQISAVNIDGDQQSTTRTNNRQTLICKHTPSEPQQHGLANANCKQERKTLICKHPTESELKQGLANDDCKHMMSADMSRIDHTICNRISPAVRSLSLTDGDTPGLENCKHVSKHDIGTYHHIGEGDPETQHIPKSDLERCHHIPNNDLENQHNSDIFISCLLTSVPELKFPNLFNVQDDNHTSVGSTSNRVNLDITTLITLVSEVCHGGSNLVFHEDILTLQAQEERENPVLPQIQNFIKGKT